MDSHFKICQICNQEYCYTSGHFSIHLEKEHQLTLKDYVVKFELSGITPKCDCGLCNEDAPFIRGKFKTTHKQHMRFDWIKEQKIKLYGIPKCPTCDKEITKWNRGEPNKYCNIKCRPSCWNQDKVKKTIKERYGVDHNMHVKEFKDKVQINHKRIWDEDYELLMNKMKQTNLEKFGTEFASQNEDVKRKQNETIFKNYGVTHYSKTQKFRDQHSKLMIDNLSMNNDNHIIKTYYYKDTKLYYQSSYELEFLELCEKLNIIDKIDNGHSFHYLEKYEECGFRLITDFSLDNYEIEIKSTYILEKQGGYDVLNYKKEAVESTGRKYLLILDKNYDEFLNIFNPK